MMKNEASRFNGRPSLRWCLIQSIVDNTVTVTINRFAGPSQVFSLKFWMVDGEWVDDGFPNTKKHRTLLHAVNYAFDRSSRIIHLYWFYQQFGMNKRIHTLLEKHTWLENEIRLSQGLEPLTY